MFRQPALAAHLNLTWPEHVAGWVHGVLPPPYNIIAIAVLSLLVTLLFAWVLDWLLRRYYWRGHFRRRRGHEAPALMRDLVSVLILTIAVSIWLYVALGVSAAGLLAASGATAVVIGLALQTMILDFFSGLSISLDGSYEIGEWLTIHSAELGGEVYGQVEGITWRSTLLRLYDGRCILIPNRLATSNPVTNHSRPLTPKRYEVEIELDLRLPSDRAIHLLSSEAKKIVRNRLSAHPAPTVLLNRIASDGIYYLVRFYADPHQIEPNEAKSIMLTALQGVIERLDLPLPVQQVELTQPPQISAELNVLRVLQRIPFFSNVLSDAQLARLARAGESRDLPVGGRLVQQGESAMSMFVILEGAAEVTVVAKMGEPARSVAVLAGGDIVGEMSLLTGVPRSATVVAITPLTVLEIPRSEFETLIADAPELLEGFGRVLAQRRAVLQGLADPVIELKNAERDLIARMRDFFTRAFAGAERH